MKHVSDKLCSFNISKWLLCWCRRNWLWWRFVTVKKRSDNVRTEHWNPYPFLSSKICWLTYTLCNAAFNIQMRQRKSFRWWHWLCEQVLKTSVSRQPNRRKLKRYFPGTLESSEGGKESSFWKVSINLIGKASSNPTCSEPNHGFFYNLLNEWIILSWFMYTYYRYNYYYFWK